MSKTLKIKPILKKTLLTNLYCTLILLFFLFFITGCSCFESQFPTIGNKENIELLNRLNEDWTLDSDYTLTNIKINQIDAFWIEDQVDTDLVILQLHGGAYIRDLNYRPNLYKRMASYYLSYTGYKVLTIDYRVAPANPFPAALLDAIEAYNYLLDSGYLASNIIIAGDSAGGGLSLALVLYLIEQGIELPKAVITMSAWTNLNYQRITPDYVGNNDATNPLISPYYGDFTGFVPMFMLVGTKDITNDTVDVANKALNAGVDVTYKVYQDMVHVFPALAPEFDLALEAWNDIGEFVKKLK